MKRILYLGNNKFVHVDSYGETHENRVGQVLVGLVVILMAAMTAGAMVGIDITKFNSQPQHETR